MSSLLEQYTIMSVDDDPMIRDIVRTILEASGAEVISAENGMEAIEILEKEPKPLNINCFILDVEMPGISGLDLLTRLKLHAETQNIPVILLTCQSDDEDVMKGYNKGAEYYIAKPFTREQLLYGVNLVTKQEVDS